VMLVIAYHEVEPCPAHVTCCSGQESGQLWLGYFVWKLGVTIFCTWLASIGRRYTCICAKFVLNSKGKESMWAHCLAVDSLVAWILLRLCHASVPCPCSSVVDALGRHVHWNVTYLRSMYIRSPPKNYFL